jgi:ribose 1,5-bisphosphokinase
MAPPATEPPSSAPPGSEKAAQAGVFVAVVGPSGVGKDSLINAARTALTGDPRFVFARRVVTRPSNEDEAHDTLSAELFRARASAGAFALWWEAHGLCYGVPAGVQDDLAAGRIVVANISRDAVAEARARFSQAVVIHVTASAETVARRLAQRGREAGSAQNERLSRSVQREPHVQSDVRICNEGDLAEACHHFLGVLKQAAGTVSP